MRPAITLVFLTSLLGACGGQEPAPQPTSPTTTPQPPTQPAPVTPNTPPRVTVVFRNGPSCLTLPCDLAVGVNAWDSDGDALTYQWSGCATGTGKEAVCTLFAPGPTVVSVEVADGHGHVVPASATAQGTNRAPYVQLTSFYGFTNTSPTLEALGNIIDPDEGSLCTGGYLVVDSVTVSGDCQPTYRYDHTCLAGFELDIYRTAERGTCTVTIRAKNSQGRVGTSIFTVPYYQGTGAPGY